RAEQSCVPAGTSAHCDQPVDAGFSGLARMAHVDDVVDNEPAIALHGPDQFLDGAERRDDQRHLVLDPNVEVRLQAWIAFVHDEIDTERYGRAAALAFDA